MSIDYDNQDERMDATCNECANGNTFYGTFQECISEMKEDGWKISKDDASGDWFHYCKDCKHLV